MGELQRTAGTTPAAAAAAARPASAAIVLLVIHMLPAGQICHTKDKVILMDAACCLCFTLEHAAAGAPAA
jgi:hypothetical protein